MKRSELVRMVKEMLDEANVTNVGGASFTPGDGAQYATPAAFSKTPSKRAKKTLTRQGYKQVSRPKRPSHTKAFDYL